MPKRMYKHGNSYRLHLKDGRKINLGRNLDAALIRYHQLDAMPKNSDAKKIVVQWDERIDEMITRHRRGARTRGIAFSLSSDDVRIILDRQGWVCAVTGISFRDDRPAGARIRPWAPSIDRIASGAGYTPENSRIVCAFVNVALNEFGDHLFTSLIESLVQKEVERRLHSNSHAFPNLTEILPDETSNSVSV